MNKQAKYKITDLVADSEFEPTKNKTNKTNKTIKLNFKDYYDDNDDYSFTENNIDSYFQKLNNKNKQKGGAIEKLTNDKLNKIYEFTIQNINENLINDQDKQLVKSTYGEIKYEGAMTVMNECNIGPQDVFFDLGSGNGKMTMLVFVNGNVKKAIGVEFFPERYYNAEKGLKNLYKMMPELLSEDRTLSYQLQNIKDVYYLGDATVIFMCSTCYPEELLQIVYNKIKESPNIRCIITHKPFDKFKEILPNKKLIKVNCTWADNLDWTVYMK